MHYDIVIVGAGIIGLSTAWQIARRSSLRVSVLEKGAGIGEGSTGASSAVCRYRYSLDETLELARDGISAYQNWQQFTGLATPRAEFQSLGVVWMPGADTQWADREHLRLQSKGIATAVLDDHELGQRYPAMSNCTRAPDFVTAAEHDCHGGGSHLLELDGGYMDPVAAAEDLAEACRGAGVDICFNANVSAVHTQAGRVSGVSLQGGRNITTPLLLNAAGPWCKDLFQQAGLSVPWQLCPTRIQILYLDRPPELEGDIPVALDMASGIYFRTQNRGQQMIVGSALERDEQELIDDPDNFDRDIDSEFSQRALHALHHRFPALPYRGRPRGYSGLYTVNRDDVHPILGESAIGGFWLANGFSGHGFKLAPAIGSLLAQRITGVRSDFDSALPLEFFGIDRAPIQLDTRSVLA